MSRFDRIAGYEAEKKELYNISKIFRSYKEFSARGIRLPHGVLLSGEPGVGKTMLAEALVEGAAVHCERIDVNDFSLDDADEYFAEKFRGGFE